MAHTRSTLRHIPEHGIFHSHRRENFKSYISNFVLENVIWAKIIVLNAPPLNETYYFITYVQDIHKHLSNAQMCGLGKFNYVWQYFSL
jgi:hypothetical protein